MFELTAVRVGLATSRSIRDRRMFSYAKSVAGKSKGRFWAAGRSLGSRCSEAEGDSPNNLRYWTENRPSSQKPWWWQSRSLFLSPHRPAAARVAPNACAVARDIAPDPYRGAHSSIDAECFPTPRWQCKFQSDRGDGYRSLRGTLPTSR